MKPRSHLPRRAFTLIELLVVITIISLLVAILLPALAAAREQGRAIHCASEMRQLGQAFVMYTHDFDEYLVPSIEQWDGPNNFMQSILTGGTGNKQAPDYLNSGNGETVLFCPSNDLSRHPFIANNWVIPRVEMRPSQPNYGQSMLSNTPWYQTTNFTNPSEVLLVLDNNREHSYDCNWSDGIFWWSPNYTGSGSPPAVAKWHMDATNMLWLDGRVTRLTTEQVPRHFFEAPLF